VRSSALSAGPCPLARAEDLGRLLHPRSIAIRQAGFGDCIDSAVMLDEWLAELQRRRILPE
jgi:hypothetical protein